MAEKRKAKRKRLTDKGQSKRFVETARELEADETGKQFTELIRRLLPPAEKKPAK